MNNHAKIKVAVGNDHSAVSFKKPIIEYLEKTGYEVINFGTNTTEPVDYPDFGIDVANCVSNQEANFGIVICGTGIGISIATNRVHGARCALVYEEETTRLAREHNNANIIALGARVIAPEKAVELVKLFLNTKASTEPRHSLRVKKLG